MLHPSVHCLHSTTTGDRHLAFSQDNIRGREKLGVPQSFDVAVVGEPRGILITGECDLYTWRALQGLDALDRIEWWLYGSVENDELVLERIPIEPPLLVRRSMIIKVVQERFLREFEEERRVTERARAKVKGLSAGGRSGSAAWANAGERRAEQPMRRRTGGVNGGASGPDTRRV
jgi:hypothetical protein